MLEKIEITGGPSTEELFLALRLFKEGRKTAFRIKVTPEKGSSMESLIEASVPSITEENAEADMWAIKIHFNERGFALHNGINKFLPLDVSAIYSTHFRTGPVTYEKISHLTPLHDLGISNRLHTILYNNGIRWVEDLNKWSETQVKDLPRLGSELFATLQKVMGERGISFKGNLNIFPRFRLVVGVRGETAGYADTTLQRGDRLSFSTRDETMAIFREGLGQNQQVLFSTTGTDIVDDKIMTKLSTKEQVLRAARLLAFFHGFEYEYYPTPGLTAEMVSVKII